MAKEILCAYGVDVDAVAGWLGSYGGEDSPDDISRGLFAGEVGTPRLLELFERQDLTTTWFIPGHSIETFPRETELVVEAGHEIGIHGYSHENPIAMSREQEQSGGTSQGWYCGMLSLMDPVNGFTSHHRLCLHPMKGHGRLISSRAPQLVHSVSEHFWSRRILWQLGQSPRGEQCPLFVGRQWSVSTAG